MLDLIFNTYGADFLPKKNVCNPAITYTAKYPKKILSISQNETDFKEIVDKSCIYEINMYSWLTGGLRVTHNIYESAKCRTFSSIAIKTDKVGKPVKTLSCNDSGNWTIPWPNHKVVVEIHLAKNTTESHLNESTRAVVMFQNVRMSSYIGYKRNKEYISMVTRQHQSGTPQYCLGDFHYKITFSRWHYNYYIKRRIMFRLVQKSVCIQTQTGSTSTFSRGCPWKINLKIGGELLMVLGCDYYTTYWCLPESWIKTSGEWLELYFSLYDSYNSYTILITSNETKSAYSSFTCPITTTTATYTTTEWYSNKFESGTDYKSGKHIPNSAIYVPVIGVIALMFSCISGASYLKSKRRNLEGRLNHRSQILYSPADSEELPRNPAYRTRDPVSGSELTPNRTDDHNSYSDPPPNYAGVIASSPPDCGEHLSTTITLPSATIPTAPPPSYEEALIMSERKK